MSIETRLRDLKQRAENVSVKKTRAEIEADNATAKFNEARATLKEEFGLNTGDEIKDRLAELQTELEQKLQEVEENLKAAGA